MASRKDIEGYVEEAIDNIRNDRAVASNLLVDLMSHIKQVLQRSNEQLVKITSLLSKNNEAAAGLTDKDKEEIYDIINEG